MDGGSDRVVLRRSRRTPLMERVAERFGGDTKQAVIEALETEGSRRRAARKLGVNRETLRGWIRKFGLVVVEDDDQAGKEREPTAIGA